MLSLSVTRRYCIKTTKGGITQTTSRDSPGTLVFSYKELLNDAIEDKLKGQTFTTRSQKKKNYASILCHVRVIVSYLSKVADYNISYLHLVPLIMGVARIFDWGGVLCTMLWRLFSFISLMHSACVVRTRFILNNFSGIGLGGPRTPRNPSWLRPCP